MQELKVADVLGVTRKGYTQAVVVPVTTANAFWRVEDEETQLRESQRDSPVPTSQEHSKAQPCAYRASEAGRTRARYTGFSRKVTACNIFGLTYSQDCMNAAECLEEQHLE